MGFSTLILVDNLAVAFLCLRPSASQGFQMASFDGKPLSNEELQTLGSGSITGDLPALSLECCRRCFVSSLSKTRTFAATL